MKKVCLLIILCLSILMTSVCFADDTRTIVDLIEGTIVVSREDSTPCNINSIFVYGNSVSYPYIKASDSSYPGYFMGLKWEKRVGESWKSTSDMGVEVFTAGTWRLKADVYIDNDGINGPSDTAGNEFRFTDAVVIKVNGETWPIINTSFSSNTSHAVICKEFTMNEPAELHFYDSDKLDIYNLWVNVAIKSGDASFYAEGGTKPYSYSVVSGPSWLKISNSGVIYGTPNAVAEPTTAVIKVTDSASASKQIEIYISKVIKDPASRTVVNSVVATSSNIANIPYDGYPTATKPTFVVTEGYPVYFYSGYWEYKNGDNYTRVGENDTFVFGRTYRFVSQVYIDSDTKNGSPYAEAGQDYVLSPDVTVTLNGETMDKGSFYSGNSSSYVYVYSKDYAVISEEVVAPTGTITLPTFETVEAGYDAISYKAISVQITNNTTVDGARLKYNITGSNANAFETVLNVSTLEGPNTWNNASLFAIRPKTSLQIGSYSATVTILYDANNDEVYETTIGSGTVEFQVKKHDPRIVISTITGMRDKPLEEYAVYGNNINDSKPTFTTLTNMTKTMESIDPVNDKFPAYLYNYGVTWEYKQNDKWVESPTLTFTVGTYRLKVRIYCDNDGGNGWSNGGTDYRLDENVTILINDVEWTHDVVSISDTSSSVYITSPEVAVGAPSELSFPAGNYNVPVNYINTPINEIDVSRYTAGGTAPYVYSKTSGPSWILVSSSGIISGTPTTQGTNDDLVVRVTDAASNYREQTLSVDLTVIHPNNRTVISTVTGFSNMSSIAQVGNDITKPSFNITDESYPAYFYLSNTYWQKKDGDEWNTAEGQFEEGTYRLKSQVYIDNDGSNGPLATAGYYYVLADDVRIYVDEQEWIWGNDHISKSDASSSIVVYSPEIVLSSSSLGDLNDDGDITILDVRLLLQAYINSSASTEWTPNQLATMDMNHDGLINILDVRLLLQAYINA